MYLDLKLTDEQKERLTNCYQQLVDEVINDTDLLKQTFKESAKGQIKCVANEILQSSSFRAFVMQEMHKFAKDKFDL